MDAQPHAQKMPPLPSANTSHLEAHGHLCNHLVPQRYCTSDLNAPRPALSQVFLLPPHFQSSHFPHIGFFGVCRLHLEWLPCSFAAGLFWRSLPLPAAKFTAVALLKYSSGTPSFRRWPARPVQTTFPPAGPHRVASVGLHATRGHSS